MDVPLQPTPALDMATVQEQGHLRKGRGWSRKAYILNTNWNRRREDHEAMLSEQKAAAFAGPKRNIDRLKEGDHVLLYQSRVGIVAAGKAAGGPPKKAPRHIRPEGEFSKPLLDFVRVEPPLHSREIRAITGIPSIALRRTMCMLTPTVGAKLYKAARDRAVSG